MKEFLLQSKHLVITVPSFLSYEYDVYFRNSYQKMIFLGLILFNLVTILVDKIKIITPIPEKYLIPKEVRDGKDKCNIIHEKMVHVKYFSDKAEK